MADSVEMEISDLRSLFWSERDPDGRVFVPLADAYRRSGDLDQAIEVLEDGLGRHADFGPAHVIAGWVRRARGETDLAERAFGAALDLDDENTEALRGLAEIAAERGDLALATDCYRKLVELEPGDLEVRARLAEVESVAHASDAHAAGFDAPALDAPALDAPALDAPPLDPWAADPERILGTDDVVRTADELVFTADEIVLDMGEPAEATEAEVRLEPEPTAPAAPVEDEDDGPVTRTMADLYARQRLNDRALRLYRRLHERTPDDAGLADRVRELEALVAAEPAAAAFAGAPALETTSSWPEPEPLPMLAEPERADEELVAEAPHAPPTVETGRSAPR
ncbi:MAG: tetratricopeptide repeat protein, partial [Gemmatimonadetes bacterium]|nr:tetratricopeptide repeat protein [Gemmatimonadota bacterium]